MDEIDLAVNTSGPVGENGDAETSEDLSLASPFLNKIPASDRAVVGRYIKDWDAGVTRKFQEYSGRLKPYESLGSVEQLQKFATFANNFQQNPEAFFRIMWESMQEQYGDDFEGQLARILQLEGLEEAMNEYEQQEGGYEEEPDQNEIFQQNVIQELEELRAWREQQVESQQYEEEQGQLNAVLAALHQQYGAFDDEGVLIRIANHGDPHKAVQEWRQMIGRYSQNGAQRQAPKVMGGQGGVPSEKVNTDALRGADRKAAVMNMLSALE